jgi:hypothetical protein
VAAGTAASGSPKELRGYQDLALPEFRNGRKLRSYQEV